MRAWCPRCDAVRPGVTACPVCATPLATLDDPAPAGALPDLPPPQEAPAPPPAPSRLRLALTAATLVLAGLAFVAGRGAARPAPPPPAAPATSTTAPEPGADHRELGWTARAGKVSVTAVEIRRFATEDRETVAELTFAVQGLAAGQQVLALRGLRLLDSGGGIFASVDRPGFGRDGVPVLADQRRPGRFSLLTGPAPRLSSLARVELAGLLVARPPDQTIPLDTAGPWPAEPPLRAIDPGPRDAVRADLGFEVIQGVDLELRVTGAFVGAGRALVVIDTSPGFLSVPAEFLPFTVELRAGDRVLCARTSLLGPLGDQRGIPGVVLGCPTRPVPRLTVALGVGLAAVPFDAALRP